MFRTKHEKVGNRKVVSEFVPASVNYSPLARAVLNQIRTGRRMYGESENNNVDSTINRFSREVN